MSLAGSVSMFGLKVAFDYLHLPVAGKGLIHALGSPDENERTLAGMFLVQSGRKALPYLRAAVARREHLPIILQIIADIGDPSSAGDIKPFVDDPNREVAVAASDAMRVLALNNAPSPARAPAGV
jgi:hypothetical protein